MLSVEPTHEPQGQQRALFSGELVQPDLPMSYENTLCPCGGKKLTETMLCDDCEKAVAGTFDRTLMDDRTAPFEDRRRAAIRVLTVSRRRNASLPLAFSVR